MKDKLTISQWAEEDRPREKLERLGPEALSNAELLAILIGSGNTEESAVQLMQRLFGLREFRQVDKAVKQRLLPGFGALFHSSLTHTLPLLPLFHQPNALRLAG